MPHGWRQRACVLPHALVVATAVALTGAPLTFAQPVNSTDAHRPHLRSGLQSTTAARPATTAARAEVNDAGNHTVGTSGCYSDIVAGSVYVSGVGTLYVVQDGGTDGRLYTSGSDSVTLKYGANRAYLASYCASSFSSNIYQEISLLGKTISYTVDLSSVGCGCNAALYMVAMPGSSAGDGTYYCDSGANFWEDCTEMDLCEANNAAWAVTAHSCSGGCDYAGNQQKVYNEDGANAYGPGNWYTINTYEPFTVSHSFFSSGGSLSSIETVYSQYGQSVSMTNDASWYLSGLTSDIASGMVLTMSHWSAGSGGMAWLDSPPCSGWSSCDTSGSVTFSGISIRSIGRADDDDGGWRNDDNSADATCTTEDNYDYAGNDLSYEDVNDASQCCDGCAATAGCTAWTHATDMWGTNRCYYKTSADGRTYSYGMTSGTLDDTSTDDNNWRNDDNNRRNDDNNWRNDDNSATCTIDINHDYAGNDISSEAAPSAAECCDGCARTAGCAAWTHNIDLVGRNRCYYKTSADGRTHSLGTTSGTLHNTSTDDNWRNDDNSATCTIDINHDYAGNDISHEAAFSAADCCDGCARTAGCAAWTHNIDLVGRNRCYYKTSAAGRTFSFGMTSGTLDDTQASQLITPRMK